MRKSIGAAFAAAVCFVGLGSSAAQADFIYNLTITGNWAGSGSVAFDAPSGADTVFSDIAGVSAFSFHVASGAGSLQDYDLADLAGVTWSIDSALNLTLHLVTALVPFDSGQSAIVLANQGLFNPLPCAPDLGAQGAITCTLINGSLGASFGALSAVPVAIPEPASIALFTAGLAGLGLLSRRRKA